MHKHENNSFQNLNRFSEKTPSPDTPSVPSESVDIKIETFNNREIKCKEELINWTLTMLGYPLVSVELTPEQFDVCISNAIQLYTKYASFPEKYVTLDFSNYDDSKGGMCLKPLNISYIKDISFIHPYGLGMTTSELAFGFSGYISNLKSWRHFSFVTMECALEFIELARRMLYPKPDWTFDNKSGMLKLYPAPNCHERGHFSGWAVATVEVEPKLEELYSEDIVKRLTLAYAKVLLGTIRSKYSNVSLPAGGTIDSSMKQEGEQEIKDAIDLIKTREGYGSIFYIA